MLVEFELIERARSGDDTAFNQIVQVYRKRILGTIARLIGRPEDVEDVGQEVFLRLYYSLDQLRTPEVFEPWLYRLTVNAAYDYLRRQKRRKESRMSDLSEQQVMMADAVAGSKQSDETSCGASRVKEESRLKICWDKFSKKIEDLVVDVEGSRGVVVERVGEDLQRQRESLEGQIAFRARQRVLKAYDASELGKAGLEKKKETGSSASS